MTSLAPDPAPIPDSAAAAPRVVMFVYNDAVNDSRVLREAASLTAAGYRVTLVARTRPTDPDRVVLDRIGDLEVIRVPLPTAWRRRWRALRTPWRQWPEDVRVIVRDLRRGPAGAAAALGLLARRLSTLPITVLLLPLSLPRFIWPRSPNRDLVDWVLRWRFGMLGWNRAAAAAAPPADVYHGHDLTALPAADEAATRTGGRTVYDSHEIFLESGRNAQRPGWARRRMAAFEARLARRAVALVTVNRSLARTLAPALGVSRVEVVHNCPPRWTPPPDRPDLLRAAAGIPAAAPVLLYHGRFMDQRGLLHLADAILRPGLEGAHAVYLGFGPMADELRAMAVDPRFGGRLHVVNGVPPDELLAWVASADVGVMVNQPRSENERQSTPNKLFECLAAGVPVVSSDFPERRGIIVDDPDGPLGAVCDPTDPAAVAAAIRSVVALPPDEALALRARCLRAAHDRWNWETESARLVALYREIAPLPS